MKCVRQDKQVPKTDAPIDLSTIEAPSAPLGGWIILMDADKGKGLRPRLGSICRFACFLELRRGSCAPVEVMTLDHLLLRTPYRVRRDQREEQNSENHEVQFHAISPFMRRQRNEPYTTSFPPTVRSLGRWLSCCCAIAEAVVAQPAQNWPRRCRDFFSIACRPPMVSRRA
jgi:hypothetical protein